MGQEKAKISFDYALRFLQYYNDIFYNEFPRTGY